MTKQQVALFGVAKNNSPSDPEPHTDRPKRAHNDTFGSNFSRRQSIRAGPGEIGPPEQSRFGQRELQTF